MRARTLFVLAIATLPATVIAAPPAAKAVGKAAPACGVKILPLVVGNVWTYTPLTAVDKPADAFVKYIPPQPKLVIITVQSVAPKGADTVVTLEEKVVAELKDPHDPTGKKMIDDPHTLTTTITCSATKFDISPDSFFYAGEPGGAYALTLDNIERKGTSWVLTNGSIGEHPWREDLVAHFTGAMTAGSHAKPATGKLEIEHQFTPQPPEKIGTPVGVFKTEKLGLIVTGRITLDGAPAATQPVSLPVLPPNVADDAWINTMWLSDNVGVVQVLNKYAHEYQLSAFTQK